VIFSLRISLSLQRWKINTASGETDMNLESYPQEAASFQIEAYKKPRDLHVLKKNHVSFTGSPKKHPYDSGKVILIADPFSSSNLYYEFNKDDISYVEELPNLVNLDGETIAVVRIWVKKLSVGVRSTPFIVEDTRLQV
jgi:inorganic pyrophosphatase